MPDTNMLRLNCLVLGDSSDRVLAIKIESSETVGALREVIKEKKKPEFDDYAADFLVLWKVAVDLGLETNRKLLETMKGEADIHGDKLQAEDELSEVLPPIYKKHLHILVQRPAVTPSRVPGILELNCLVLGQPRSRIFTVKIAGTETVGALKEAIKDKKKPEFDDCAADSLNVWKVKIDLKTNQKLLETMKVGTDIPDDQLLDPLDGIFEVLSDVPLKHLHVMVRRPELDHESPFSERGNIVGEILTRYNATISKALNWGTPSQSAKSNEYRSYQKALPIYDGRYNYNSQTSTTSPPIQLFHPVFGHFLDDIANQQLEVSPEILRASARFMISASGMYEKEHIRKQKVISHLAAALCMGMTKIVNQDLTSPDDSIVLTLQGDIHETVAILIHEDKRELGDGGSDPSIQAGLSMSRFWTQSDHRVVRENSCCPTFLLATGGPWLTVLGAVFTDKVVVQHLTDFLWVGADTTHDDQHWYRIAHILHCLSRSLATLNTYYLGLKPAPIGDGLHHRFFPSIHAYRNADGEIVNFEYVRPLERDATCITFLATTIGVTETPIVVKFVGRYGVEAHRLLEKTDAAPHLFYYGDVGVSDGDPTYGLLRMVVMEYLDGMTAGEALEQKKLPTTFLTQVGSILQQLHDNDFVFGDLRGANIMITEEKVKFIDFDWAAKAGVSRYPLLLSKEIQWPDGVKDGLAVMEKMHDLEMLSRLVP